MPKAAEAKQEGAPEWMVTYGDMMTLLLCFFVILVAMGEIKEEEKFRAVTASLAKAFGYHQAVATIPGANPSMNSLFNQIRSLGSGNRLRTKRAASRTRAVRGEWRRVRRIRDGLKLTIGGPLVFEEGSAQLTPALNKALKDVSEVLRGKPNKIVVVGHASRKPLAVGSPYADHWDLAYKRAKAVVEHLVKEAKIDPRRIRISTAGCEEPVRETPDDQQRAENERVDIFVTEAYVRDYLSGTVGGPRLPEPTEQPQESSESAPAGAADRTRGPQVPVKTIPVK